MPAKVSEANEDELLLPVERSAEEPHVGTYAAAMITAFGIRPILMSDDVAALKSVRASGEPAMLFGLSVNAFRADEAIRDTWVSGQGIAASDGLSLFDLHRVEVDL